MRNKLGKILSSVFIVSTTITSVAMAQNAPASGPVDSEKFPKDLPSQPRPSLDPLVSPDPLGVVLDPWNDFKRRMDQNAGLKIEGAYTLHNQYATETLTPRENEFGGRLDLSANWTVLRYGDKDVGQIVTLMRASHNIGISQQYALSDAVGSIDGTNSLHGGGEQIPISLNLLYWRQTFANQKFIINVGKIHPNSWIDLSPIANDETKQFMAGAYTGNLANPGQGLWSPGIALEYKLTDRWYVNGVIANALGKTGTSGLNNLDEGHFYKAAEIGYKTGEPGNNDGNYRLTAWHNNTPTLDGYGFSVGFDQQLGTSGWTPFARFGMSEAEAAVIKQFFSIGLANVKPFDRRGDMFGIAGTISRPSNEALRDEILCEVFYRIKLTESLEFSPDVQWVINPAFQPAVDNVVIFGARLKLLF